MKTIYFLLIHFFLVYSVSAQWSTDPLVNTIVNDLGGSQAVPHIAYDAAGNFYVGFYSNETGNYNIRLQYYNWSGVAQWAADGLLISDNAQNTWITDWALTVDNSGNCVMAFNDVRDGNANVYAYAISPSGSFLWGNDGIALTTSAEDEYAPRIAVTSANNVIVSWQRPASPYNLAVIQKISPTGTLLWGSAGLTYQSGSYNYGMPQVMGVENDHFLMAFYKETGSFPGLTRHIYVQKFNAAGSPVWASDVLVSNSNGISAFNDFEMASDGANGVVIAWTDDRNSDNNINAAANRILSDGTSLWPANGTEVSNINTDSDQIPLIVGVTSNDEVIVTWSRKNGNQSQTAVAGQKFSTAGVPLWTNAGIDFVPMSASIGGSVGGVVFDGTNALIVYDENVTSSAYSHLKALAVDGSGNMIWSPSTTLMAGRTTSKVHSLVSSIYNDQLIAVWEEGAATDDIYMQNIFTDGSIGTPPISDDASLSDLTVNGITVDGFSPAVFTYDVPIPTGDPLPVTGATASHPAATLVITQAVAVPGLATVLVTAEDGVTQLTYDVNFYVAGTDATLTDLTVDGTTIAGFAPNVFNYDYQVATGDPIPVAGATPADPNADMTINQATSLPGVATVVITSEDGLTTNTYTVNFLYTPATDATLADLLVGGTTIAGFDPAIYDYSYAVIYNEPAPYVQGIPNDPLATLVETQCIQIPGDATVVVTAEDGVTVITYTVHFYYLGYNATLSDLTVDGITIPDFDPNITDYQHVVENTTPIPVVDGTTSDPLATLTITQASEIPGTATLHVVAEDGVSELTYTVYFFVLGSDATLSDLTVDGVTIEWFNPFTTEYLVSIYEGDPIPVLDGVTTDPLATKEVVQATTVPGDGTITVTAQDGVTQMVYTVIFDFLWGINDRVSDQLFVFPNPATDQISVAGTESVDVRVIGLTGELIIEKRLETNREINVAGLKPGVYFVEISMEQKEPQVIKLIKK